MAIVDGAALTCRTSGGLKASGYRLTGLKASGYRLTGLKASGYRLTGRN